MACQSSPPDASLFAVDRTETINEDLRGVERADVEIGFGTGTLRLAALPEGSSALIKGTADLSPNEQLTLNHSGSAGVGRLTLRSQNNLRLTGLDVTESQKAWDLELNRDIPIRLDVDSRRGDLDTGSGAAEPVRPDCQWRRGQSPGNLAGAWPIRCRDRGRRWGEFTLTIPQGLAARIRVDGGLGGVSVDGDFNRRDREYTSPNYGTAENRATIQLNGGMGRILIRQVTE